MILLIGKIARTEEISPFRTSRHFTSSRIPGLGNMVWDRYLVTNELDYNARVKGLKPRYREMLEALS